jgi:hypothetical protein
MPVIIEEVVGTVHPEAPGVAEKGEADRVMRAGRALPDPRALRADLQRMAGRQARLRAD